MKLNCRLARTLARKHGVKLAFLDNGDFSSLAYHTNEQFEAFRKDIADGEKEGTRKLANELDRASDAIYEALYHYGIEDDRLEKLVALIDSLVDEYDNEA